MKKSIFIAIFLLFVLIANVSFASYSTVTMSVVEEPVCTIQIGENSKFQKQLISKDLKNKEVTLELKVTNEEIVGKATGEIILVLDNSDSMKESTSSGSLRKDLVFNSAKTLITNLLKDNTKLKIGVVSFSTTTDVTQEGTNADAKLISSLSNNVNVLTSAIDSIEANGPRTDLEAGLTLASNQFSKDDNNKYMIILTDGVPNVALDYDKIYYSDSVISKTKERLQQLQQSNIRIVTMLTGIDTESYSPSSRTVSGQESKTFAQIISDIFGTTTNPTSGSFYYITDDKIEQTITNDIYNSLIPAEKSYKNIKVVDYFPKEIIDNFDFSYVSKANVGEISANVNKTNNSITWTIPELKSGETASVQYKLKLKENFDESIVDKILDTNKKVDVSYTDLDDKNQDKTSNVTPKLKLTEPQQEKVEEKAEKPVTPTRLPDAGIETILTIFGVLAVTVLGFSFIKLIKINKDMK